MKYTKIVATVNGATCTPELLEQFYRNGMDVVRFNSAHLGLDELAKSVKMVRAVSDAIAIMLDTKGPNLRICGLDSPLQLKQGEKVELSGSAGKGDLQINYAKFVLEVELGQHIVVDDGAAELKVIGKTDDILHLESLYDCRVENNKSVNAPGAALQMPSLTDKDRIFIDFAVKNQFDFIAHSFVRDAGDVHAVKECIRNAGGDIPVIAKIENRQGVDNLEEILREAEGIMVARGDLGIEIPLEEVPPVQKKLINSCMRHGKVVITATQMLQSMEHSPHPTRAEVSDVANAVFDGTDAVMLSGETAQGKYPVEAIAMMSRIIRETERTPHRFFTRIDDLVENIAASSNYLIHAALESVESLPVKCVICRSDTGDSARLCASYRARIPIFAFCSNRESMRRLALSFGVFPDYVTYSDEIMPRGAIKAMLERHKFAPDDLIVLLAKSKAEAKYDNLICIDTIENLA